MSIADKLATVAENVPKVFEAGKQAEYDHFWDAYQDNGNRTSYLYGFMGYGWTDETFKPKYPLTFITNATSMFNYSSVEHIDCELGFDTYISLNSTFHKSKVKRISKFKSDHTITFPDNAFSSCTNLTDISFVEGSVIGKSINFKDSPLTAESAKRVIAILKDYSGTTYEYKYSVTFSQSTIDLLEAEGNTAPNGDTWMNYIQSKGWTT